MHEHTYIPEQLGNLKGNMEGLAASIGDRSLLASIPLLRKTGGRDIYAQHSLEDLYTNEKHTNHSTEYLDFDNDYILSEEDKEALNFITHSYDYAVVVDIADILLTVHFLQPHVKDGWVFDSVIDAYAYIANVDNSFTSVVTNFQSRELSEQNGAFDSKNQRTWTGILGGRCVKRQMVFVPFNVWGCHWCLLVVNKARKEIQILNSLAEIPQFRNQKMEKTLVANLQACIEYAAEDGFITHADYVNITQWRTEYYTNIPQQKDCNSCGIYVLKYMLEWNGVEMRHNFTKDQMDIFRRKICCRLLHSECNKSRRTSYKDPITKQQYLAENPTYGQDGPGIGLEDDIYMINAENGSRGNKIHSTPAKNLTSTESIKKDQAKPTLGQKKRGRPRKDGHNTKEAAGKQVTQKGLKTSTVHVRGENQRACNPSQYMLSPYKQK
ncbi:hypothetical protein C2845_PM07G09820 [Panicum miliaceum]|uniref:Ubiquitin-like protease family profile domain-containing protein n=1 Tax=Panicum miliaceum TaxID=4540 RepID=A0A3L6SJU8_PANMI|nr:hypothetical protein C2845_PM07G09820 [Panicum miliaceum]